MWYALFLPVKNLRRTERSETNLWSPRTLILEAVRPHFDSFGFHLATFLSSEAALGTLWGTPGGILVPKVLQDRKRERESERDREKNLGSLAARWVP